jgi:hypothetical protein
VDAAGLSDRAARYLAHCERWPAVPTGQVERSLREGGWPCPPAWLEFHDRYAGYLEHIHRDTAVWGLAHEDSFWFGSRQVCVEVDEGVAIIHCADLHPVYTYRLDDAGRFQGAGAQAESFDIHVERLALWREFVDAGPVQRIWDPVFLRDQDNRRQLLDRTARDRVPEASDRNYVWYVDARELVVDDPNAQTLRSVLRRT